MLIITIVLCVVFLFWLIPLKRRNLIEGIFEKEALDYDLLSGKQFKSFTFRDFCKSCVESWRETGKRPFQSLLAPACHAGIHAFSLNIGSLEPKAGDAIKLVAWQTIFGRYRLHYFQKSDFQWTNWYDEEDRQEAKKGDYASVEEYKIAREKEWHEKACKEAMLEHGLTREEAETLEFFGSMASTAREAKRRGITYLEADNEWRDKFRNPDPDMVKFCENLFAHPKDYVKQFIESGSLEQDLKEHLNKCDLCNGVFVGSLGDETKRSVEEIRKDLGLLKPHEAFLQEGARRNSVTPEEFEKMYKEKIILRHGGKDCFTAKERIIYAREGGLLTERMDHTKNCIGCERMIEADRKEFLDGAKLTGVA